MKDIITNIRMTSLEIAELTGVLHKNLMRDIRKMEEAWVKRDGLKFELVEYKDKKGESRPMYNLSKSECLYIATKYNDDARAGLIMRWEELEVRPFKIPSGIEIAKMYIESEEENLRLKATNRLQQEALKKQAPKAIYYDEVMQSNSTYTVNQVAKELGYAAVSLNKLLNQLGIQYKQNNTWLLYAKHQNKGYTRTKTWNYTGTDGESKTSMQTVWTEKGRHFIHEVVGKFNEKKLAK